MIRRYIQYSCNIEIENEIIRFQNLIIDVSRRQVLKDDKEISLTKTEFNLLYYFAKHNGQTLTKEQIYMNVWNGEYVVDDRNIITHIQRLRQKIEDNSEYIHTIRGVGYRFSCPKCNKHREYINLCACFILLYIENNNFYHSVTVFVTIKKCYRKLFILCSVIISLYCKLIIKNLKGAFL